MTIFLPKISYFLPLIATPSTIRVFACSGILLLILNEHFTMEKCYINDDIEFSSLVLELSHLTCWFNFYKINVDAWTVDLRPVWVCDGVGPISHPYNNGQMRFNPLALRRAVPGPVPPVPPYILVMNEFGLSGSAFGDIAIVPSRLASNSASETFTSLFCNCV